MQLKVKGLARLNLSYYIYTNIDIDISSTKYYIHTHYIQMFEVILADYNSHHFLFQALLFNRGKLFPLFPLASKMTHALLYVLYNCTTIYLKDPPKQTSAADCKYGHCGVKMGQETPC